MSKQPETSICFPGEESWELWRSNSGVFELAETAEMEEGSVTRPFKSATHFAFPTVAAFAVPVWASSEDKAVVRGVVEMHLEGLGVKPGNPVGELIDHRVVSRHEGRSLVLATVLSEGYELSLPKQSPNHFDVSARFLVLPRNHITVWKELGRLVLAVTRDDQMVHFQALSAEEVDGEAMRELKCMILQLGSEGIIGEPAGLVLWTPAEESVVALAQEALGLRVIQDYRPTPVLPETGSKLLPTIVAIQRIDAERRKRIRMVVMAIAALWLAFIGYSLFGYFKAVKDADQAELAMKRIKPNAVWIPEFKARWRLLEPAVDPSQYPAVILRGVVAQMPAKGVRLVSFNVESETITIKAEAESFRTANDYGGKLMAADDLSDFKWVWLKRPGESKRRDKTFEFSIQGTNKYSKSASN